MSRISIWYHIVCKCPKFLGNMSSKVPIQYPSQYIILCVQCAFNLNLTFWMTSVQRNEKLYRLPMAERVGCGTPCLLGSLGVQEVVGSRPTRRNSKESFSSHQETGKVFSPEMPFYSKF